MHSVNKPSVVAGNAITLSDEAFAQLRAEQAVQQAKLQALMISVVTPIPSTHTKK